MSKLFILQNVITANQNRVYIKGNAVIPRKVSNANALVTTRGPHAKVSIIAIMYIFKHVIIIIWLYNFM